VCQACGQRIVFVKMIATGKRLPVDPIPVDDGNVSARLVGQNHHGYVISAEHPPAAGWARFAAHYGTCPDRPRANPKPKPEPPPALFDL
jgi:hypothetical protein